MVARPAADERNRRASESLEGLSVGDAFGECFFVPAAIGPIIARAVPKGIWRWTDDTQMAATIADLLVERGAIDQDVLAARFAERMEPMRGYGAGAYELLLRIRQGERWQHVSRASFRGEGSFGNGAAMRVAPLGAYFADDLNAVVEQASKSAEVTHAHAEGMAGAIAVAVAAASVSRAERPTGEALLEVVRDRVPRGATRSGIDEALRIPAAASVRTAAATLGNGSEVTAQDTVPLCLWVVAHRAPSYQEALWQTVGALGDRDTTCAIVGGIVAARDGLGSIPADWRDAREPLPAWAIR